MAFLQGGPSMHMPNSHAPWWSCSLLVVVLALVLMSPATARSGKLTGPDLIVRSDVLSHQWVVRDENLPSTFCSVQEGEVTRDCAGSFDSPSGRRTWAIPTSRSAIQTPTWRQATACTNSRR